MLFRSAALGAAGLAAATLGVAKFYDAATKRRDYNAMLRVNPHLEEARKQDPAMFNQMYTSLRNANRAFAKDPLVAGRYMSRMVDEPMAAGGVLTEAMTAPNVKPMSMAENLMKSYSSGYKPI